jgi:hypothetical protein
VKKPAGRGDENRSFTRFEKTIDVVCRFACFVMKLVNKRTLKQKGSQEKVALLEDGFYLDSNTCQKTPSFL